jgi:O-antigen ligase
MAWREHGSIAAEDWLPYGILAGLLLATVLLFADGNRPSPFPLAAFGAIAGLSLWTALSAAWSPVPTLARDEALLISVYGFSLAIPALTLSSERSRLAGLGIVALTTAALAVATAAHLVGGASPDDLVGGRLTFPVSYVNANAAIFLVGFWSGVALGATRRLAAPARGVALGAATAVLAAWLATQSKGGAIALAASAVVVLAVAPGRLRLVVPLLVPPIFVAAAYRPLTAPFRADGDAARVDAGRDVGVALLAITGLALITGIGYALADRRIELSPRGRRAASVLAIGLLACALAGGVVLFASRVDDPRAFAADKWEELKKTQPVERGSSHLVNLGSNRYDYWRVSLDGFREHPVAGTGARGFAAFYLREGNTGDTPARAHSIEFDALLELGLIGFMLVVVALGAVLAGLARRAEAMSGAAALGTFAYFTVHASGDWVATLPAVGVPAFAVAGIALATAAHGKIARRAAIAAGGAAAVVALAALPPVLSARLTDEALRSGDAAGLATARRLDPLSVDPWIAEFTLARTDAARIQALRQGLEREPRSIALRLLLGRTLLAAGRRAEAIRVLEEAKTLDPRGEEVGAALERARREG